MGFGFVFAVPVGIMLVGITSERPESDKAELAHRSVIRLRDAYAGRLDGLVSTSNLRTTYYAIPSSLRGKVIVITRSSEIPQVVFEQRMGDSGSIERSPVPRVSALFFLLPESIIAKVPDEVRTVILLDWSRKHNAYYGNLSPVAEGFSAVCRISIVSLRNRGFGPMLRALKASPPRTSSVSPA